MKLPASVLATLCAVGCEAAYVAEPTYPTQPVEVVDPTIETIEPTEFATPPPGEPGVAPVTPHKIERRVVVPVPVQPQIQHRDPCPACGMG